jgi:CheY-like chemotaxis protein
LGPDIPEPALRLLLAEDEPMQQEVLAQVLTEAGYAVTTVDNGDALTEVMKGDYSLVVTDRGMPGRWLGSVSGHTHGALPAYVTC